MTAANHHSRAAQLHAALNTCWGCWHPNPRLLPTAFFRLASAASAAHVRMWCNQKSARQFGPYDRFIVIRSVSTRPITWYFDVATKVIALPKRQWHRSHLAATIARSRRQRHAATLMLHRTRSNSVPRDPQAARSLHASAWFDQSFARRRPLAGGVKSKEKAVKTAPVTDKRKCGWQLESKGLMRRATSEERLWVVLSLRRGQHEWQTPKGRESWTWDGRFTADAVRFNVSTFSVDLGMLNVNCSRRQQQHITRYHVSNCWTRDITGGFAVLK